MRLASGARYFPRVTRASRLCRPPKTSPQSEAAAHRHACPPLPPLPPCRGRHLAATARRSRPALPVPSFGQEGFKTGHFLSSVWRPGQAGRGRRSRRSHFCVTCWRSLPCTSVSCDLLGCGVDIRKMELSK